MIIAVPGATAVTLPEASTVATLSSLLDQVTVWISASAGPTEAFSCLGSSPTLMRTSVSITFNVMAGIITISLTELDLPSSEVTVRVVVPCFKGVNISVASLTATTVSSLLDQGESDVTVNVPLGILFFKYSK